MSNIVPVTGIPAALAKRASPDRKYLSSFGELTRQDMGVSMLKICQGASAQTRPGWGPTKQEPAIPVGSMFLSRTGHIVPPGTNFIPLKRTTTFIKWASRDQLNKQIEFITSSRHDPRIKAIKGLDFIQDQHGKVSAPIVTEYLNYYVLLSCMPTEPVILGFKHTSLPQGRAITQDLTRASNGGVYPMHGFKFTLNATGTKSKGSNTWSEFSISPAGAIDNEEVLLMAEKMAAVADMMAETADSTSFEDDGEVPETPEAPPVNTTPILQAPPALQPNPVQTNTPAPQVLIPQPEVVAAAPETPPANNPAFF